MDKRALAEKIAEIFYIKLPWWECPWDDFGQAVTDIMQSFEIQEDVFQILDELCDLVNAK